MIAELITRKYRYKLIKGAWSRLPVKEMTNPVFIIGYARSGTSILGFTLSRYRQIAYLHEPRDLWATAYPVTYIWRAPFYKKQAKLILTADDVDNKKSVRLRRLFKLQAGRKPVLVEKTPVNVHRLDFIRAIFPDAKFIHIWRNGLEVACSAAKRTGKRAWDDKSSYFEDPKLTEYASRREEIADLLSICSTDFDRALLKWRLAVEAAAGFFRGLDNDAFFELSYEELIEHPDEITQRLLSFIGVDDNLSIKSLILPGVRRKSRRLGMEAASEKTKLIGGELLPLSTAGSKGLHVKPRAPASGLKPGPVQGHRQ